MNQLGNMQSLQMNQSMLDMLQQQCESGRGMLGQNGQAMPNGGQPGQGVKPGQGGGLSEQQEKWLQQMANSQGQGQWSPGNAQNQGSGSAGQGRGGAPPENPNLGPMQTRRERFETLLQRGEILSMTSRMGTPEAGEMREAYAQGIERAREESESAMWDQQVPPALRDTVREYFDAIGGGANGRGD